MSEAVHPAPVLIEQESTVKFITNKYFITKTDFLVLTAVYMSIKKDLSGYATVKNTEKYLKDVKKKVIYKSLKKLTDEGFLHLMKIKGMNFYRLTNKAEECIRSYSGKFGQLYNRL